MDVELHFSQIGVFAYFLGLCTLELLNLVSKELNVFPLLLPDAC